jgi:hypothetical protein
MKVLVKIDGREKFGGWADRSGNWADRAGDERNWLQAKHGSEAQ